MFVHTALSLGLLLISNAVISQPSTVLTVSPGGLQEVMQITDACPTFSWGRATGATRYKMVVFDVLNHSRSEYAEQLAMADPVLQASIEAPALSWTPATNQCLDQGGSYLWFIQASTIDGVSDWSRGRHFDIDLEDAVLAEAIRQEVTIQLSQPTTWRKMVMEAFKAEPAITLRLPTGVQSSLRSVDTAALVGVQEDGISGTDAVAPRATFINPSAFRVSSTNGVLFDVPNTNGLIPAEGAGTRFMWYPAKIALRAGHVEGTQWDDTNIGAFSTATGFNTTASGMASTAMGNNTTASNFGSTAMGMGTTASGTASTAMGNNTTASNFNSTAMGSYTTASGWKSTAMGSNTTADSYNETVIGSFNTPSGGDASTWVPSQALFVIGNGESPNTRHNAMVVLKNGNTGIGTSTPVVPLHIGEGSDCKPDSGGYLVVNGTNSTNLCFDNNEILARNNGVVADLTLNYDGAYTIIGGYLRVNDLTATSDTHLCVTALGTLASCSSSGHYKEKIEPLLLGMRVVEQLEPVSFKWKDRDEQSMGFIAEQVAAIDPMLATYNKDGDIQGVKYPQLTAVLVNSIQEQQRQHIDQEKKLLAQQTEISSLRKELQQYRNLAAEVAEIKHQLAQNPQLLVGYLK